MRQYLSTPAALADNFGQGQIIWFIQCHQQFFALFGSHTLLVCQQSRYWRGKPLHA
jgi:hypothetical protein